MSAELQELDTLHSDAQFGEGALIDFILGLDSNGGRLLTAEERWTLH